MKTALLALVIGSSMLWAANEDSQIKAAEKDWAAAVVAGKDSELEKILGDGLIYAHSSGAIESKKEYLDRMRTGKQKYDKLEHESTKVVPYKDAVVAHSMVRMSGISNGNPFNDHLMMMHVWVKQNGAWRLVAHQTTKLPQ